jgi:hypothetical protein
MVSRRRRAVRVLSSFAGLFALTAVSVGSGCATSGTGLRPSTTLTGLIMLGPAGIATGTNCPCDVDFARYLLASALTFASFAFASRYASGPTLIFAVLLWYVFGQYYWAGWRI